MPADTENAAKAAGTPRIPRLARPGTWLVVITLVYAALVAIPQVALMADEFSHDPIEAIVGWGMLWPFMGLPLSLLAGVLLARLDRASRGKRPRRAWLWLMEAMWANLLAHFLVFAAWTPALLVWAGFESRLGREMEEIAQSAAAWLPLVLGGVMVGVTRYLRSKAAEPTAFIPGALRVPSVVILLLAEVVPLVGLGFIVVVVMADEANGSWLVPAGLLLGWLVASLVASVGVALALRRVRSSLAKVPSARQVVGVVENKLGTWGLAGGLWILAWSPVYMVSLFRDAWHGAIGWDLAVAFLSMGFVLLGVALVAPTPFRRV